MKIKIDSYDSLPIEKRLSFDNAIIPIKPVLNKDKNLYLYYKRGREGETETETETETERETERNSERKVLCHKKAYGNLGQ